VKINNDLIIKCAISNGWNPVVNKDISVYRAKTMYDTDLGEWWLQQSEITSVRRVTDIELKTYLRDINLEKIGI
jgi:hypothetical protein